MDDSHENDASMLCVGNQSGVLQCLRNSTILSTTLFHSIAKALEQVLIHTVSAIVHVPRAFMPAEADKIVGLIRLCVIFASRASEKYAVHEVCVNHFLSIFMEVGFIFRHDKIVCREAVAALTSLFIHKCTARSRFTLLEAIDAMVMRRHKRFSVLRYFRTLCGSRLLLQAAAEVPTYHFKKFACSSLGPSGFVKPHTHARTDKLKPAHHEHKSFLWNLWYILSRGICGQLRDMIFASTCSKRNAYRFYAHGVVRVACELLYELALCAGDLSSDCAGENDWRDVSAFVSSLMAILAQSWGRYYHQSIIVAARLIETAVFLHFRCKITCLCPRLDRVQTRSKAGDAELEVLGNMCLCTLVAAAYPLRCEVIASVRLLLSAKSAAHEHIGFPGLYWCVIRAVTSFFSKEFAHVPEHHRHAAVTSTLANVQFSRGALTAFLALNNSGMLFLEGVDTAIRLFGSAIETGKSSRRKSAVRSLLSVFTAFVQSVFHVVGQTRLSVCANAEAPKLWYSIMRSLQRVQCLVLCRVWSVNGSIPVKCWVCNRPICNLIGSVRSTLTMLLAQGVWSYVRNGEIDRAIVLTHIASINQETVNQETIPHREKMAVDGEHAFNECFRIFCNTFHAHTTEGMQLCGPREARQLINPILPVCNNWDCTVAVQNSAQSACILPNFCIDCKSSQSIACLMGALLARLRGLSARVVISCLEHDIDFCVHAPAGKSQADLCVCSRLWNRKKAIRTHDLLSISSESWRCDATSLLFLSLVLPCGVDGARCLAFVTYKLFALSILSTESHAALERDLPDEIQLISVLFSSDCQLVNMETLAKFRYVALCVIREVTRRFSKRRGLSFDVYERWSHCSWRNHSSLTLANERSFVHGAKACVGECVILHGLWLGTFNDDYCVLDRWSPRFRRCCFCHVSDLEHVLLPVPDPNLTTSIQPHVFLHKSAAWCNGHISRCTQSAQHAGAAVCSVGLSAFMRNPVLGITSYGFGMTRLCAKQDRSDSRRAISLLAHYWRICLACHCARVKNEPCHTEATMRWNDICAIIGCVWNKAYRSHFSRVVVECSRALGFPQLKASSFSGYAWCSCAGARSQESILGLLVLSSLEATPCTRSWSSPSELIQVTSSVVQVLSCLASTSSKVLLRSFWNGDGQVALQEVSAQPTKARERDLPGRRCSFVSNSIQFISTIQALVGISTTVHYRWHPLGPANSFVIASVSAHVVSVERAVTRGWAIVDFACKDNLASREETTDISLVWLNVVGILSLMVSHVICQLPTIIAQRCQPYASTLDLLSVRKVCSFARTLQRLENYGLFMGMDTSVIGISQKTLMRAVVRIVEAAPLTLFATPLITSLVSCLELHTSSQG